MADTTSASIVTLHQPQPARAKTPAERAKAYRHRKRAAALSITSSIPEQCSANLPAVENVGARRFDPTPFTRLPTDPVLRNAGSGLRKPAPQVAPLLLTAAALALAEVGLTMNGWYRDGHKCTHGPLRRAIELTEIVVRRDGAIIHAVLHWQGGDHTQLQVKQRLNAAGRHNPRIPDDTIALVPELARLMPDRKIARLFNRTGVETGHGNAWTQERVRGFRNHDDIAVFRDGEWAERGEITLEAAAKLIGVCSMTALRMLRRGDIKGR